MEIDLDLEAEFCQCSVCVRNVNGWRGSGRRTEDLDVVCSAERGADCFGEFADGQAVGRADVVGASRFAAVKDGEEPFDKIVGVQVTAQRRAVALNDDRLVVQAVLNEVSDGEMDAAVEVGAGKGEAPGDECRNAGGEAKLLGGELATTIGCRRDGGRIFGDGSRLRPVDGP